MGKIFIHEIITLEIFQLLTPFCLHFIRGLFLLFQDSSLCHLCASLSRYICCSICPLLSCYASIFKQLKMHLHVIDNFLICCFRLFNSSNFSSIQLDKVTSFFIAILKYVI